ncbi:MAG: adenylate/guanylate cyclase domain-containing protein [Ignavibacteriae bacterium]|nr:adenylate/guanylate cyclase domain-containing protein [Ignavibacteriota bacterium]
MARAEVKKSKKILFLNVCSITSRVLSGVMIGIMLLFFVPIVIPFMDDAATFRFIRSALIAEREISALVKKNIPTKVSGKDVTRVIVIIGTFILSGVCTRTSQRFRERAEYLFYRENLEEWKSRLHLSDNAIILSPLNRKLEQLKTARRKDREQLLREFAEMKKQLDEMGRDLAFLSIDVVDSMGIKEGEERAIIEHDFREYKHFIERTLASHGCVNATWTPDGVMSCFTTVDAAVKAARGVLNGLDDFNRMVKTMRRDFAVRCGVNSGFVYYDESIPLEEISDRVIDIAAHMQKNAKPNSVCVAKPVIEPLSERNGFEPAGRVVDGYEVYEWRKA